MIKRISRISPLQFGVVTGTLYALLALVFVPFLLIFSVLGMHSAQAANSMMPFGMTLVMAVLLPVLYGVLGFVFGIIGALVYNFVAGMTGGFEITLTDVAPPLPVQPSNSPSY